MSVKLIRTLLALAVVIMGTKTTLAFDDGDFQYWNTESASVKINDYWKFNIEEEFRFGDNARDFYYQHSDIGLSYSGLAEWLDVSANYRAVLEEKSGDWAWENRPHLNAALKIEWNNMKLSNRSRLEFRIFQEKEDKLRYRNKTTIKFPVKWTRFKLQPYLADEIFIDFESAEMTRNRVYAGFGGKYSENISGSLYYILQSSKSSGTWKDTNVLGTKIKVSF